jgi:trypsin
MKIIFSASTFLLLAPVVVAAATTIDNSSSSRSSALLLRGGDAHTAAAAAIPRTHKSSTTILWETSKQHQPREIVEDVELQRRLQQRELKPTQKIVGGEEAEAWEYPYYVDMSWCGGMLIAPQVVMTAAHCGDFTGQTVVVGEYDKTDDSSGQQRVCTKHIIDPKYDDYSTNYDFALCYLGEPIDITSDPARVTLKLNQDATVPADGEELQVTGFGDLASGSETYPTTLREALVPYLTNAKCNDYSSYSGQITDAMMCAGFDEGGIDSCQGDSGGPIISRTDLGDGKYEDILVGVVSWGYGCALAETPGVYARVSSNIPWIQEVVCNEWDLSASSEFCSGYTPPAPTSAPVFICDNEEVIKIDLTTDSWPEETSIMLYEKDGNSSPLFEMPQYSAQNTANQHKVCLQKDTCYTFEVSDTANDGLCAEATGENCGSFSLTLNDEVIFNGDPNFGSSATHNFCTGNGSVQPQQTPTSAPVDAPSNDNPSDDNPSSDYPSYNPADIDSPTDISPPETFEPIDSSVPISLNGWCPKGRSKFQVEIQTDDYPTEMYWQLVGSDGAILAGSDRTYVEARTKLHAPSEQEFYCLEIGSYTFKMLDSQGDGFCCSYGSGHMIGMLEGEQIFEGGEFEAEELITFTVEELPEAVPTAFPTKTPTPQPTRSPTSPPTAQPTRSPTSPPTRTPADCAELQATYGVVLKKTTGNQCIWMSLDENGADCQICAEESSCEDESGKHWIHLKSNGTKLRPKKCAWVGKSPNGRCKKNLEDMIRTVADVCPETCGTCEKNRGKTNPDEAGKHWIHLKSDGSKLRKRTCAQVAENPNALCKKKLKDMIRTVADICPETCGK